MNETRFLASDGKTYLIAIDDSGEDIHVSHDDSVVGTISLRLIESDDPYQPDIYHITHLALDECSHRGIGRRCLQLHRETFASPLTAAEDNGTTCADGSHLTGDGPGFIAKMRREGLVCSASNGDGHYNRFDE